MGRVIEVVERYELPDFPTIDLPEEDGVPLESNWHRMQINLLLDNLTRYWAGRKDYVAGGNMFIYYSERQARNRDYRGPDIFVVKNVDGSQPRRKWVVWEEDGRYPDVIVELLSPSTLQEDLGRKKELYERTFHTRDYFCYDPDAQQLLGWRLKEEGYVPSQPNAQGRLWSAELNAWIGAWKGSYLQTEELWLRLFDPDEKLIPIEAEAARQEAQAAEQKAQAAEQMARATTEKLQAAEQIAQAAEQMALAAKREAEVAEQRANSEQQRSLEAEAEVTRLKEELTRLQGKS